MRTSMLATVIAVMPACIDNSIPMGSEDTGGHRLDPPVRSAPQGETNESGESWSVAPAHNAGQLPEHADTGRRLNDEECGSDDLLFTAEVRDSVGDAVEVGFSIDEHRLWARIENPCTVAVMFDTESRCLVEGWRIDAQGSVATGAFPCGGPSGTRTVAPESFIEQEIMPLHDLMEGDYALSVVFGHAPRAGDALSQAAVGFEILSRGFPQALR